MLVFWLMSFIGSKKKNLFHFPIIMYPEFMTAAKDVKTVSFMHFKKQSHYAKKRIRQN